MEYFKIIKDEEAKKINDSAIVVLNTIGLKFQSKRALKTLEAAGAYVNYETTLVKFPTSLVENAIKMSPKKFTCSGRNQKHDMVLEPNGKTYSRPLSGAEGYLDLNTREYRLANESDVKDWAILCDGLENISYCASPYPSDLPTQVRDVLTMKILLENTEKCLDVQPYSGKNMEYMLELAIAIRGSKEELKKRPIFIANTSPLPPLQFSRYATDIMYLAGEYGIPVALDAMPIAGGNGPITIAGNVLLAYSEALAGGVFAQIANPKAPLIFRPSPVILDMSTGVSLQGAVENAMMSAALTQVTQKGWGIPTNMFGHNSDSLKADGQSMIERSFNALLPAIAGANIVSGAGQLEHDYTEDPVQLVIDNESLGMIFRLLNGIDVNEDTIAVDVLSRVGPGGNFLTDDHTLKYLRSEYFRPNIFTRDMREIWESKGSDDLEKRAQQKARTILDTHIPVPLPEEVIKELNGITKNMLNKLE